MSDIPFDACQKAQGAVLTRDVADSIRTIEFGPDGFPVVPSFEPLGPGDEPVHFGSPRKEFERAENGAVLFDLSRRGHLKFTGADRQKFLNGFCTADVANLKPGEGCEAFITNIKGKVLGHVFVFAGQDALWLDTTADAVEPLIEHLTRYVISEDVEILAKSQDTAELLLSGPKAKRQLIELMGEVPSLSVGRHHDVKILGTNVALRRVDWLGERGYLLVIDRQELSAFWNALLESGVKPAGMAVFHAMRILKGLPLYGIDITDENLAQEVARTEKAINFKKGCYLGQEPIARIDALGHVNRELRSLKLKGVSLPIPNSPIQDDEGKQIGRVTSYAIHPKENVALAMGYLKRGHLQSGTEVFIECEGSPVSAEVLPTDN